MTSLALDGVPELASRTVQLRPLLPSDGEWCYALMCGPAGARWRYRGRTPSHETVAADLWRGVHSQYVVVDRRRGAPVGLVGLYNVALDAGRAHAFALADPPSTPLVVEGFGLLCSWAFEQLQLSRIFVEAPEFNLSTFTSLSEVAVVEGRLRNYELWQGRFWDLLILSIVPEAFFARYGDLLTARRSVVAGARDATAVVSLVEELWPLDSLGLVEALDAIEELAGAPLDVELVAGLPADDARTFVAAALALAEEGALALAGEGALALAGEGALAPA